MPISIYPPILQSTQPAFLHTTNEYSIYFTLQPITSYEEIGHIQIRIVRQTNNRSIVNTSMYPDGVIYKSASQIKAVGQTYHVSVQRNELQEPWQPGYIYKIQVRFGTTPKFISVGEFAKWKQQQIDNQTFSEWSTVMIVKAISKPDVYILNAESIKSTDIITKQRIESSLTPLFIGVCDIPEINKEAVDKYRFTLRDEEGEQIETSGWLQHSFLYGGQDKYRFKHILENNSIYTVLYEVQTVNGYSEVAEPYEFQAVETYLAALEGVDLLVESKTSYCKENGCINISLTTEQPLSGSFVIIRSSEATEFSVWEDLAHFAFFNQEFENTLIYQDFTIESGVRYRYAFQMENAFELRTSPTYPKSNVSHWVDFEYSYLYRDGIQLKLKFNQSMNTFKHTTLSSKQDTLGDKYPHLTRNGYAYYAEFPVTGLISFQTDADKTFMTLQPKGFYYRDDLAIPRDKFAEVGEIRPACEFRTDTSTILPNVTNYNNPSIDTNLTGNNIFIERRFRERVEEFLNDFNYKLYRSPTEGNIVVGLMNVSLTPNAALGRMIFEFSATAYEVLENTLENLDKAGIINIGSYSSIANDDIYLSFGQVKGIYTNFNEEGSKDVYEQIRQQEEVSIGGGYRMQLENIRAFWVERYPQDDFDEDLIALQVQKAQLESSGEDTEEVDLLIAEHEKLQQALSGPSSVVTRIQVDGVEIAVLPNKIYSLRDKEINSLIVTSATYPIIINYVVEMTYREDLTIGVVSQIDTSRIWGQISGVFTGTDEVLKTYNYNYNLTPFPYRVYSSKPEYTGDPEHDKVIENSVITYDTYVEYDKLGRVLIDNTNFNVYKTINLYEIIKEETRHQVEFMYNIKNGFYVDDNGEWTDGTIYYNFSDIITFDIEADENTILYIGTKSDGSDAKEVIIGPTGRYILNPMAGLVKYIALKHPQFAVINYKCLTTQMKKEKRG